jgi:hypothetical protein
VPVRSRIARTSAMIAAWPFVRMEIAHLRVPSALSARQFRCGADSIGRICWWRLPAENGAATVGVRAIKLFRNEVRDGGTVGMPFKLSGLHVQPPQRTKFFITAKLRFLHGRFEHLNRLVVDLERHREWVSILAAVCN